ncbi:MAG TPA: hypothetical protein VGJ02_01685 [Pyrinomonadaceae bacterium]
MRQINKHQSGGSTAEFLVVAVIAIVGAAFAIFAFPSLLSSGKAGDAAPPATSAVERANEAVAIGSLRAIASAEDSYASTNRAYGTFDDLSTGGTIDARWTGTPTISGYRFELTVDPAASKAFCAAAMLVSGQTGGYSYAVSNRGAIYRLAGGEAPDCDPATGDISSGTILGG